MYYIIGMTPRKAEVGSIVRPPRRTTTYVVVERSPYTASAHNDRWQDFHTKIIEFDLVSGETSGPVERITTDDVFRNYDIIGKVDISSVIYKVENIELYDFPDDAGELL